MHFLFVSRVNPQTKTTCNLMALWLWSLSPSFIFLLGISLIIFISFNLMRNSQLYIKIIIYFLPTAISLYFIIAVGGEWHYYNISFIFISCHSPYNLIFISYIISGSRLLHKRKNRRQQKYVNPIKY